MERSNRGVVSKIQGCDYHPGFQQIAFVDTETGEFQEQRQAHREEAEKFYRDLAARGVKVRVGMEASGQARWFERLLAELKFELWIGGARRIAIVLGLGLEGVRLPDVVLAGVAALPQGANLSKGS